MGRKGVVVAVLMFVLFLNFGCASQIMKSYVGKDIREAIIDYGPPVGAIDMPDGQRAFQWTKRNQFSTPMVASTSGSVNKSKYVDWYTSNTTITGGEVVSYQCVYTVFSRWDEKTSGWIITGFRKPKFMCE